MKAIAKHLIEADLHHLSQPLSEGRISCPKAVSKMAASLVKDGQKVPLVAVKEGSGLSLLDGYLRLEAARQCGWDTVWVEVWDCELETGMVRILGENQARRLEPVEEGYLLRELMNGGRTVREVAGLLGRDASWVSRRVQLVTCLPEEALAAVREGTITSWAAVRVLAPMARANKEDASRLLAGLKKEALSTRELEALYRHYRGAGKTRRERIVSEPGLFVKALKAREQAQEAESLRSGPEGKLAGTVRQLKGMMNKLRLQAQSLLAEGDDQAKRNLARELDGLDRQWQSMKFAFERMMDEQEKDARIHPDAAPGRMPDPGDRPQAEAEPQRGEAGDPGAGKDGKQKTQSGGRGGIAGPTLPAMRRQRGPDPRDPGKRARPQAGLLQPDPNAARGSPS
jgi:ParB family transcriptional regulator, chromosome partitioning protein